MPGHYGARAPGPLNRPPDPRTSAINEALRILEATSQTSAGAFLASDPHRAIPASNQRLGRDPLQKGLVVHAMASLGWYRVQVANLHLACCQLSMGGLIPLGARDVGAIPPNSQVLVFKPEALPYGFILGVIPPLLKTGKISNPDWLVPGGQSGLRREAVHTHPIASLYKNGGVLDFSGQRPLDSTSLERGLITATGIALLLDDYQAFLRVNEQCGLFLSYFDGHARLAGLQLDLSSLVHEESSRDDEGEARWFRGIATYPWEALGLPAPGTAFTQTYTDAEVQQTLARAKIDLPSGQDDVQPAYRWQEYGGYLGQGHLRLLMLPHDQGQPRLYRHTEADEGLFCESIAADGGYLLRSAKSILIAKRSRIVVPKETLPPEDPTGDDARAKNYRFSGQFGTAAPHLIADVDVTGELTSERKAAATEDYLAFQCNWKNLHPFHYHELDYAVSQEASQGDHFQSVQEIIDFGVLAMEYALPDPAPVRIDIDPRLKQVGFTERESFVNLDDDGNIVIGNGAGARIKLVGGKIRLECPGDIEIAPGRDVIALGDQIVLRARQALDATVAQGDLRLKAEHNLQILAANSGTGGLLLESKSTRSNQDYADKTGADVAGNGIVLKAAHSTVATLASFIYLRTGGPDLDPGGITLDAGKGADAVNIYANSTTVYCSRGQVSFVYGPSDETSNVGLTYSFGPQTCIMNVGLALGGPLIGFRGQGEPAIILDGSIAVTGSVAAGGSVASSQGGFLGQVPTQFTSQLKKSTDPLVDAVASINKASSTAHQDTIVQLYYQDQQLGADAVIPALGFSYRDSGDQYHTASLRWIESDWQQRVRLGSATGGNDWTEPVVTYANQQLLPWPGRAKWQEDDVFYQLAELTMYDPTIGSSKDRPEPYTLPALADWQKTTMSTGYKLVRKEST